MQASNVESVVSMPIVNPETGRSSRTFIFMGVVDRIEEGKIVDWKGVSDTDRFCRQRRIGFQGELYALAVEHAGSKISEIEYRLICRPTIKFCDAVHIWACMRDGRKSAVKVFDKEQDADEFATTQGCTVEHRVKGDADRNAYENRCLEWLRNPEYPTRIFQYPYFVTSSKLEQARWYLWESGKRLLENRNCNRWLPNEGACFAYDRECPYLSLCEAVSEGADYNGLAEADYTALESSHPELQGADDCRDVLTYSSLTDLSRCEMFYQWKHERKLRKGLDADTEPLWVGSAIHRGLEACATGGLDAAFIAIDEWEDANPVLGEDAGKQQDTQVAKARAMVRAAVDRWPINVCVIRDAGAPGGDPDEVGPKGAEKSGDG